jgi:hypothetical protein
MRLSRVGILILLSSIILIGTNCAQYNRLIARRNLVDGATAYKDRKFSEAEAFFRKAVASDTDAKTEEGKTARLFLARTLHSQYAGDRSNPNAKARAEEAIKLYRASVADNLNDQSSYNAVANLYETLGGQFEAERPQWQQELEKWTTERAENTNVAGKYRADAYASLASKQYSCANEISDVDAVKTKVKGPDGKEVFKFVKPANTADYDKFVQCVQKGVEFIDKAVALEDDEARNAKNVAVESLSAADIAKLDELVKIWAKVWSFKASLMNQSSRRADMDGNAADKDSFKAKSDEARTKFLDYTAIEKKIEAEKEKRARAADPSTANSANTNANTNK